MYQGLFYQLPARLGDNPPTAHPYDSPPPVGVSNDAAMSFEGEGPTEQGHTEQSLRENAQRSRNPNPQNSSSDPQLVEENARLREELFELQQELERTRLERTQARERADFYRQAPDSGRGYHPYPQSARSASGYGTRRERSPGPNRSTSSRMSHGSSRARPPSPPRRRALSDRPPSPPRRRALPDRRERAPRPPTPPPAPIAPPAPPAPPAPVAPAAPANVPVVPQNNGDPYANWEDDDDEYDSEEKAAEERKRRSRAIGRAARRKVPPPTPTLTESTSAVHGEWANKPIKSRADWRDMRKAIIDGDNAALRYLMYLNTKAQHEQKHLRSPGEQEMLADFNGLVKRDDVAPRYRAQREARAAARAEASTSGNTAVPAGPAPTTAATTAVATPTATTRPVMGPSNSLEELVAHWRRVRIPSWPRGLRLSMDRYPGTNDLGYADPHPDDLWAIRFLLETQPVRRHQDNATKIARNIYRQMFLELFSIQGLYAEIITRSRAPLGTRPREGFPFDTRNMEIHHVAFWLHDHGLAPHLPDVGNIERWASVERSRAGESRLGNGDWTLRPQSAATYLDEHQGMFGNLSRDFAYPALTLTVGTRHYRTALESLVNAGRSAASLPPIAITTVAEDEEADVTMGESDPSGDTNTGPKAA